MSDTPQLLLAHHLKALRLPTFLREYDKLAQQCAAEGVDHPRYLLRLAELELIERERRMIDALGGALLGQLVVFAQEGRQPERLQMMSQQQLRRVGHGAAPASRSR